MNELSYDIALNPEPDEETRRMWASRAALLEIKLARAEAALREVLEAKTHELTANTRTWTIET